jgi:hypothetical protein
MGESEMDIRSVKGNLSIGEVSGREGGIAARFKFINCAMKP